MVSQVILLGNFHFWSILPIEIIAWQGSTKLAGVGGGYFFFL